MIAVGPWWFHVIGVRSEQLGMPWMSDSCV